MSRRTDKIFTVVLIVLIAIEAALFGISIWRRNIFTEKYNQVEKLLLSLQSTDADQSEKIEKIEKDIDSIIVGNSTLSTRISLNEKNIESIKKSYQQSTTSPTPTPGIANTEEITEPAEVTEAVNDVSAEQVEPPASEEQPTVSEVLYEQPEEEPVEAPVEEQYYEETETVANSEDNGMTYYGAINCTAYTHTGENTASGAYPVAGVTVASNDLPFGTVIYIEGYGERVVQDTGYMPWASLDLFFDTEEECVQFGEQVLDVYIVG